MIDGQVTYGLVSHLLTEFDDPLRINGFLQELGQIFYGFFEIAIDMAEQYEL